MLHLGLQEVREQAYKHTWAYRLCLGLQPLLYLDLQYRHYTVPKNKADFRKYRGGSPPEEKFPGNSRKLGIISSDYWEISPPGDFLSNFLGNLLCFRDSVYWAHGRYLNLQAASVPKSSNSTFRNLVAYRQYLGLPGTAGSTRTNLDLHTTWAYRYFLGLLAPNWRRDTTWAYRKYLGLQAAPRPKDLQALPWSTGSNWAYRQFMGLQALPVPTSTT
jgi:hypothetical protein